MRLIRIWDYVMRRKLLLVVFFVMLASGFCGCRFVAQLLGRSTNIAISQDSLASAPAVETVDNGLALQILGENQALAYQVTFRDNFRQAVIEINTSSLASETYVRILDAAGNLVAGEYTVIYDQAESVETSGASEEDGVSEVPEVSGVSGVKYYFPGTPKSYQVALTPGMRVELRAENVRLCSTLSGVEVAEFAARAESETYVVMDGGLRREDWSEIEAQEVIYRQLKRYAGVEISAYQAEIPEYVLHNRKLDVEKKTKIMRLYAELLSEDQAEYTEFIEELRRGGKPTMSYRGATEYKRGDKIDFLELIDIHDNEDGELAREGVKVVGEVDFGKAGSYELSYMITDSDGNTTQLQLTIVITEERADAPSQIPSEDQPVAAPIESIGGDDMGVGVGLPEEVTTPEVGGGIGADNETMEEIATGWGAPELKVDYGDDADTETSEAAQITKETGEMTKVATAEKTTRPEQKVEKTAEKADNIEIDKKAPNVFLLILGGLVLCGLAKFIFDHYVR